MQITLPLKIVVIDETLCVQVGLLMEAAKLCKFSSILNKTDFSSLN
jgi:hypothetical protein